jgi:hypothetical protein
MTKIAQIVKTNTIYIKKTVRLNVQTKPSNQKIQAVVYHVKVHVQPVEIVNIVNNVKTKLNVRNVKKVKYLLKKNVTRNVQKDISKTKTNVKNVKKIV